MQCPNCGAENQTGNYCGSCGAALDATCAACGADVPAGASFCTACGEPVGMESERTGGAGGAGGAGGTGGSLAPGIIGVVAVVIVIVLVVLYLPGETRTPSAPTGGPDAPFMGTGGSQGGAPGMGGLSSDMRTNADRLFNRVMMAAEEGNQAEVDQFMPMAVQAYEMVEELDHDGLFHLGMLYLTAGSHEEAVRIAQRILDDDPDHLLGLAVAAQAESGLQDTVDALDYWNRFLDAYPTEANKPLPEYVDHQPVLPTYQEMAREATGRQP